MEPWLMDAQLIRGHIEDEPNFKTRCERAFEACFDSRVICFSVGDDNKFRAATAALLLSAKGEDKEWVESQLRMIQKFNAMLTSAQAGLAADVEGLVNEAEKAPKRDYRLMDMFRAAKEKDEERFKR